MKKDFSYKDIIFWLGIFITILTYILVKPLSNLDEIWNFNIARCISTGLIPYKDISMVSTPFLGLINAVFLKIFGAEMFINRILASILAIGILILVYKICRKIGVNKTISYITIIIISYLLINYFCLDYNFFSLFIALIILLLELNHNKYNFIIGILGGLAIWTKQSVGILLCAVIVINQIFFIKEKSDIKKCLKAIGFRILGICIPILIFVIYLAINNALLDFIDYSILGIKTFSNKIPYSKLIHSNEIIIKILSICIPIILIISTGVNLVIKCLKKENKIFYLLTIYCLPIFTMAFPISDNIHFLIGIMPAIILCIYILSCLLNKIKKIKLDSVYEYIHIICLLGVILLSTSIVFINFESLSILSKYTQINHFKYIIVSNNISNSINQIDNYIKESDKEVYILDASAALYMIPLDKYNKNYDMFLKGNIGSGGETKQIENIKNKDAKYLILKDIYGRNWQNPEQVRAYIKENLEYIESIGIYDVYENKIEN